MAENFVTGIQPFHAMEILKHAKALEAKGKHISYLLAGEPGAPPAPSVIEAVRAVVDQPQRYTDSKGTMELRRALSDAYANWYGVSVDPHRFIITMGSSSGFLVGFHAAFEKGATIALTRPNYPAYLNTMIGLGYQALEIPVTAQNGWRLTADDVIAAHDKQPFDGLLLASPANPTGAIVGRDELKRIVDVCNERHIRFISDEIYHGLSYAEPCASALEFGDDAIVVNSFSKYYCMTGWRIGWMVLPEDLVRKAEILQQNFFVSASSLAQTAGLAALQALDYCEAQKALYAENRDILTQALKSMGFEGIGDLDGAFYAYANISKFSNDSMDFCKRLLNQAGVAATPGIDFDRQNGNRFVRFSYAGDKAMINDALARINAFVNA